jgi:hypothetical protein
MNDSGREIDEMLVSEGAIPKEKVVSWIESCQDIRTLAKLYRLTRDRYYQIQPELGQAITCDLIQRYLLRCIEQDTADEAVDIPGRDKIEGRWEAAASLHVWFRHLSELGDSNEVLSSAAAALTAAFLRGTEEVRGAIEMGFLEHALETEGLRRYFEPWSFDSRLREAWQRALEWGKAHPDLTWGLLQRIPKPED